MAPIPYDRIHILERPDVKPSPEPMIHSLCQGELDNLCDTEIKQAILKNQIKRRMDFYHDHPNNFFVSNPLFEYYETYNDHGKSLPVYVMRFNRNKLIGNLRIFCVVEANTLYMLHAFVEKGKKTYKPAYNTVKTRLS